MDEKTKLRIDETKKIMKRVRSDGFEHHRELFIEALEYFLMDVLSDADFERLKLDFKKDFPQ